MKIEPPPLAKYRSLANYEPKYGDYVIWSKWFTTWHGIVANYEKNTNIVQVIFAGLPFLLFTMNPDDHAKETVNLKLSDIRQSPNGKYSIQSIEGQEAIWYI